MLVDNIFLKILLFPHVSVGYLCQRRNGCMFDFFFLIWSYQELKLKEQIKKVTSIASLTVVCELVDQKPEAHLEDLPCVGALKRFAASSQFNEVLKKPSHIEEKSGYVCDAD